jgi:hypothetical protein
MGKFLLKLHRSAKSLDPHCVKEPLCKYLKQAAAKARLLKHSTLMSGSDKHPSLLQFNWKENKNVKKHFYNEVNHAM